MLKQCWSIRLLGALNVSQQGIQIDRFRSQKTGALLAYLAYWPDKSHTRAELIELLWPESELEAGQQSLRVALTSLRRQLEPPGVSAGSVIRADRIYAGLNPEAFTTDVAAFQQSLGLAGSAREEAEAIPHYTRAVEGYQGELLPGYYEDWILIERNHLTDAYLSALGHLIRHYAGQKEYEPATELAWRAVQADPLRESSYRDLLRLCLARKRPAEAHEVYTLLERRLRESLGASPSRATRELMETLSSWRISEVSEDLSQRQDQTSSVTQEVNSAPTRLLSASELPVEPRRYHLPPRLTRFFGREEQIAQLIEMLDAGGAEQTTNLQYGSSTEKKDHEEIPFSPRARLVTLTGPGGTGKTRLALEVGTLLQERFPGGAAFVSLAHLMDPRLIPGEVRDALATPRTDPQHPLDDVVAALSRQPTLLILDNLEQIAEGAAPFVRDLLLRVPSLTCLLTSRRSLGIKGEREFPVSSLPLPQPGVSPEQMLRSASMQLFLDRARAVLPDFQITERNRIDISALCQHLDGMPLAIELAAARARVLTPAQMLAHLKDRFHLLIDRRAGKDARHRSLRATIEWSLQLLPADVRRFFARLSVFRGGWTLEAAEAVCLEARENGDALDFLEQLRIDSLVQAEPQGDTLRFRMLESLREFGSEQLSSEEREHLNQRHADYFISLAEAQLGTSKRVEMPETHALLNPENDNMRSALLYLLAGNEDNRIQGLRLATRLSNWWYSHAAFREGSDWLERALAAAPVTTPPRERALALREAGRLAGGRGDNTTAHDLFQASLEIARHLEDPKLIAYASMGLAVVFQMLNELDESERLCQECLEIYRALEDPWQIALALVNLGSAYWNMGDLDAARNYFLESLQLGEQLGSVLIRSQNIANLAGLELMANNLPLARTYCEEAMTLAETLQSPLSIAYAIFATGSLEYKQDHFDSAKLLLSRSLKMLHELGERRMLVLVLVSMALLASAMGRHRHTAQLVAAILHIRKILHPDFKPSPHSERYFPTLLETCRTHLPATDFEHAQTLGSQMTLEQTLEYALFDAE